MCGDLLVVRAVVGGETCGDKVLCLIGSRRASKEETRGWGWGGGPLVLYIDDGFGGCPICNAGLCVEELLNGSGG